MSATGAVVDDGVGLPYALAVVGGRRQPACGHQVGELVLELGLAGERLGRVVDEVHDSLLDIDADHLVPSVGELDGQGQTDLAEPDHGDLHDAPHLLPGRSELSEPRYP